MVIDHIGIVVKSIDNGIEQWRNIFGYAQMTKVVVNTRQKVKVVFMCKKDSLTVKLVEPVDETSPVYTYAKKGGGLHHLCFKCKDLNTEVDQLKHNGLRILASPEPGEAFGNNDIAFIYANNGLNVELIDTDVKADKLHDL